MNPYRITQDIKNEAFEQPEPDIKFAFENQQALVERHQGNIYNGDNFDEDRLKLTISEKHRYLYYAR